MVALRHAIRCVCGAASGKVHKYPAGRAVQQFIARFIEQEKAAFRLKTHTFIAPCLHLYAFAMLGHAVDLQVPVDDRPAPLVFCHIVQCVADGVRVGDGGLLQTGEQSGGAHVPVAVL